VKHERVQLSNGEGGKFLKLENNAPVNGIVRGDVLKFYQDWQKGQDKKVFDKPTPGASPRFKTNLVVFEDGKFVAKIWEYPPMVSNLLADLEEAGHDLDTTILQIKKIKKGDQTTYSVVTLAGDKNKLSAKHIKELNEVELNPLTIVQTNSASAAESAKIKNHAPSSDSEDSVPF
jgi:hypothetical protein